MDHQAAASYLLAARHSRPGAGLPAQLRPATEADAYEIQRLTLAALGHAGGWKVGAAGPTAAPSCAPMPGSGLQIAPATLSGAAFTTRDIESEIAFVMAADLPSRRAPYTRQQVLAAIGTCHPGIEVLQSRFADPAAQDALSNLADLIRHGAYVLGVAMAEWHAIDFAQVRVVQTIDGAALARTGNPAGDMLRLVIWLANTGAAWDGGLRAGQVITCGSWTGATPAPERAAVSAEFAVAQTVLLNFN